MHANDVTNLEFDSKREPPLERMNPPQWLGRVPNSLLRMSDSRESHVPLIRSTLQQVSTIVQQLLPKGQVRDYISAALTLLTAKDAGDLIPLLQPYLRQIIAEFAAQHMPDKQKDVDNYAQALVDALKRKETLDISWEILCRLVGLSFTINLDVCQTAEGDTLLERIQNIADIFLPPLARATVGEIADSFRWKDGDRFVIHRCYKPSPGMPSKSRLFCTAYTNGLAYVHIDGGQDEESKKHFDALTNAFRLCTEVLDVNPLKRFLIPYSMLWPIRTVQDFASAGFLNKHEQAAEVESFILAEKLDKYDMSALETQISAEERQKQLARDAGFYCLSPLWRP